jgi:spore coat protein CotH
VGRPHLAGVEGPLRRQASEVNRHLLLLFAAGLISGCGGDGSIIGPGPADDDDIADDDDALDDFYGLETIHEVAIELDDDAWDALLAEPFEYVEGALTIDGATYDSVGVRQKGRLGSFVPIDADEVEDWRPPKPALLVDLDRYVDGLRHEGLEKLVLNNHVQDASGIHEFLGYALFEAADVPSSRAGWATVELNGVDKGLYVLLEAVDDDTFLERWYGSDEGNLYEGTYGADLRWKAEWFEQDHGDDTSRDDLYTLIDALEEVGEDDDGLDVLEEFFDLEEVLAFATTELVLGHWDGYAWTVNNYRIHHHPETGVWTFVPWGIDQIFEDHLEPYAGVMQAAGPEWTYGGRVHQVCIRSPGCRELLADAFAATLERIEDMDLAGLAEQARDRVGDVVVDEAEGHGFGDWAEESLDQIGGFLQDRPEEIERWLPCLQGGSVDVDGDGYNGCDEDCDDHAPDIHPGAAEHCNFIDDDCNGVLDDGAECPPCQESWGPDGETYGLCPQPTTWADARQTCISEGGELASFHDQQTAEDVTWALLEHFDHWVAWIGLTDADTPGDFAWTDGSALDFTYWEADDAMDWGDCVVGAVWGWWATSCEEIHPFICRAP